MELSKEGDFELPGSMVSTVITFQYFVDTLEQKCPEAMQWAEVVNALRYVCRVVMVRTHHIVTIELD